MIKLLACDVDGTLLPNGEACISADIKCVLDKLLNKGINVVIASGRSYRDLTELFDELSERLYFVCHDGALGIKQAKTLYKKAVSQQNIADVAARYADKYKCTAFYAEDKCYVIGETSYVARENAVSIKSCRDIKEPIYKLAVYDAADRAIPELAPMPFDLRLCSHSGGCIEYVPAFANKGTALRSIQSRLFLTELDTLAVGNDVNDIKMFKSASCSAAVLPCGENVVSAATVTIKDACEFLSCLLKSI